MRNVFNIFDRGISWADFLWRAITFIVVVFGGTTTALLAKTSELLKNSSPFISVVIGIVASFVLMLILYLFQLSRKQSAHAKYLNSMSVTTSNINPLAENFENEIINLSDLYLPLNDLHSYKHFKGCKIVGPGALVLLGGTFNYSSFEECGDVIMLPNQSKLAGIVCLENCTLTQCTLINMTIITNYSPDTIEAILQMKGRVIIGEFKPN